MAAKAEVISNRPLREAFERSPLTAADLARILGYQRPEYGRIRRDGTRNVYSVADGQRVRRQLGIWAWRGGRFQMVVTASTAERYAAALDLDPVDLGL